MNRVNPLAASTVPRPEINLGGLDRSLAAEVRRRSGTELNRCYQCRSCGSGCPFIQAMDYPPHGVLRLVQYGLRQEALGCGTIWICVACHTCSSQCPMAIDIAAIMDALRHMALEEGVAIARPEILSFHEEVIRSLERYGRAHKLGIMWRYKLMTRRWFSDMDVGLKMLVKRKLDLIPSRVKGIGEITPLCMPYGRK